MSESKVKRAIVLIEYNPEKVAFSVTARHRAFRNHRGIGMFKVTVNVDKFGARPIETTAHELGHVLQDLFSTPVFSADPRNGATPLDAFRFETGIGGITPQENAGIIAGEEEAWEFAKLMVADLNPVAAELALKSYKDFADATA